MNFSIFNNLNNISLKKFILIINDILCLIFSLQISKYLIYKNFDIFSFNNLNHIIISIIVFISIYNLTGQYRNITRYIGSADLYDICIRTTIAQFLTFIILILSNQEILSLKIFILATILIILLLGSSRILIRDFIYWISKTNNKQTYKYNIAIYGAGKAGFMLFSSLQNSRIYNVKYFFDDNALLNGRYIKGIKIINSTNINKHIKSIDKVFLAIPSLKQLEKKKIINKLLKLKIEVLQIPTVEEISSGKFKVDNLRQIPIQDLLGREAIQIKSKSIDALIKGKITLVTGAGGSIGTELCNQILKSNPSKIILLENSEPSLYLANQKLNKYYSKADNKIIPILGDVCDEKLIDEIFNSYNISNVFHSAAYKHVPIVELNPLQGLKNNIFSTYVICLKSIEYEVEQMTLISSDKAVRPTNIMGASKRFSELIIQAFDYEINKKQNGIYKNKQTNLSMVRFGNVLDSSGSVVPLFRDQIASGGPITLTHKNIIRYFMTIEEASQLVLQASALSQGGDLFLLDMGNPIKILDLARKMIYLSGLTVKDKKNPSGDIEIITTGLRPGEKLYEELLIDAESEATLHPQIYRAKERFINPDILFKKIKELKEYLDSYEKEKALNIISELIPDWNREKK